MSSWPVQQLAGGELDALNANPFHVHGPWQEMSSLSPLPPLPAPCVPIP